jgi:hypothetical protein
MKPASLIQEGIAIFIASLLLALCVEAYAFVWSTGPPPIRADGWGYYLPLPAVFIHGDPTFSFLKAPDLPPEVAYYRFAGNQYQGLSITETGYRDKYALGPAVMQLPFFLGALAVARSSAENPSGFEAPFQAASALAGAFYFALGAALAYGAARRRCSRLASGRWSK